MSPLVFHGSRHICGTQTGMQAKHPYTHKIKTNRNDDLCFKVKKLKVGGKHGSPVTSPGDPDGPEGVGSSSDLVAAAQRPLDPGLALGEVGWLWMAMVPTSLASRAILSELLTMC